MTDRNDRKMKDAKEGKIIDFAGGGDAHKILHYGNEITPNALKPSYVADDLDYVSAKVAADGMICRFANP